MCQGIIVSIVKWPHNGKVKRFIQNGIGSHSDMAKRDADKIKEVCPCDGTESLVSAESDFTKGWGGYKVESGLPDKNDLRILKREFKKCAGSAQALIAHVKKHKKIDIALVEFLTHEAQKVCDDTHAPAWKVCDDICAQARKVCDDTCAQAWKVYNETRAQAWKVYDDTRAQAWKVYDDTCAQAWKVCDDICAQARKVCDETRAQAWCKLFRNKQNRIKIGA